MDIRRVTDSFAVSGQIDGQDVPAIAAQGFNSIVCNRPDDEEATQPAYDTIAAAATTLGLSCAHVPSISGAMTREDVSAMARAMTELPAPVLAYCRTGTRSISLWAIISAKTQAVDTVLQQAMEAGYDLGAMRAILDRTHATGDAALRDGAFNKRSDQGENHDG